MTKIAFFSSKPFEQEVFEQQNLANDFHFEFFDFQLTDETAQHASGCKVVCAFVNDDLSASVLKQLAKQGTKLITLRCTGHDKVDLKAARIYGIQVAHVPDYSPESIAEHAVALLLNLMRKLHKAHERTREADFSLNGLEGEILHGKTVGIVGTGNIGVAAIRILKGFGMKILCHDPYQNEDAIDLGVTYCSLDELLSNSDVISLHCPSHHGNLKMLDSEAIGKMKDGTVLVNTSRGNLIDSEAVIEALNTGKIKALGIDLYSHEQEDFFAHKEEDSDELFRKLSKAHNVIFTGHQAYLTQDAIQTIAAMTVDNIAQFLESGTCDNRLSSHPQENKDE